MFEALPPLLAAVGDAALVITLLIAAVFLIVLSVVLVRFGALWFQAYMSSADVSMGSLIGMGFRRVPPRVIVTAKVMAAQAGLNIDRNSGISTSRLEAHYLAGGNVQQVIRALIAAKKGKERLAMAAGVFWYEPAGVSCS